MCGGRSRTYASGEKRWLSAPDSNQWCLPGCITTIFSPGIIVVWIWADNATRQGWWMNVAHCFLPITKTRRLVLVGTPEARFSPSRAFPSLSTRRMSAGLSGCCTHRWCPWAQHSDSWPYWFGWAKVANKRMRVNLAGRIGFLLWVFSENSNIIQRKPGNIRKFAVR